MLTLSGISLENAPPLDAIKGSLIEIIEKPGLKASIIFGISDEKYSCLRQRNFLSSPERFRSGSYYLN